ncbi:MAG: InlB B-repeat-containing protein, partial [Bacilli bacterium]|nr:InlB B-repeat-containing protein [Bacilli bacterium]
ESLNVLKAEYQKVLNKYYNEPLTKQVEIDKKSLEDAIKYHESEIERLEKEVREGTHKINSTERNSSDKVTVKFNTNGVVENMSLYKPIVIDRGNMISLPPEPVLLNAKGMNQIIEFEEWTLNGEPYDFTQPVNENITLDAKYKKFDLHSVSYYDENKKNLFNETVKHGDIIVNPKKLEDKNLKIFEKWVLENGDDFDFSEPITEPVVLYAKYKRNWKKIAAIGAGVITGALTTAADQALGTSLITSVTNLSSLGAAVLTNYKLKNHKTELKPTENLKGIKKANAKLVNYFRDNNNIINLRTFFKSAFASTLVGNVVNIVDNTVNPEVVNDSSLDVNVVGISDLPSVDSQVPEIKGR